MNEVMMNDQIATVGGNLFDDFKAFLSCSPKTLRQYMSNLRTFARWINGHGLQLEQVARHHIADYKAYLLATKAPATANSHIAAIKRFYEWMEDIDRVQKNPARHVKAQKLSKDHKRDFLSETQIESLYGACNTLREKAAIALLINTGIRINELANIQKDDFVLRAGKMTVNLLAKGHVEKDSYVIVPAAVMQVVKEYMDSHKQQSLFASKLGTKQVGVRALMEMVTALLKRAGIKSLTITCHSLRHTFAAMALKAGCSLYDVSVAMRHSSTKITQIYSHGLEKIQNFVTETVSNTVILVIA